MNSRLLIALALLTTSGAIGAESLPPGEVIDRVVAVVQDHVILLSELRTKTEEVRQELKSRGQPNPEGNLQKNVLDQMINEVLLTQEIQKQGLSANDSTIDAAIASVMKRNGIDSLDDFRKVLRSEGLSIEEYRQNLKKEIEQSRLMNEAIRSGIEISEQDIDAAYRRKLADSGKETKYRVRMIFKKKVPKRNVKAEMEKIRKEVVGGASFEKTAERETEGPGKDEGGNIGTIAPAELQPALAKALATLKPGEISAILEAGEGYYLLQNVETVVAEPTAPAELRPKIRDELTEQEAARRFDAYARGLREKAHVKVLL